MQLVYVCCYLGEAVEGQGLFRHKEADHHVPSHRAIRRGCQPKQCNTLRAQTRLRPGLRAQQQDKAAHQWRWLNIQQQQEEQQF